MGEYSLFQQVFETVEEKTQGRIDKATGQNCNPKTGKPFEWYDEILDISREAEKVQNGATFDISNHIKKIVLSLLSCQRPWSELEIHFPHDNTNPLIDIPSQKKGQCLPHMDEIFMQYDCDRLLSADASIMIKDIKGIQCSNRRINWQIPSLLNQDYRIQRTNKKTGKKTVNVYHGNIINVLNLLNSDSNYGFLDFEHGYRKFTTDKSGKPNRANILALVALLSGGTVDKSSIIHTKLTAEQIKACKMNEMGAALVCEYLKGFGISVVKPDVHVCRVLNRLGYIDNESDVLGAIDVCYKIADEYDTYLKEKITKAGLPSITSTVVVVDTILWQFAAKGKLEICIADTYNKKGKCFRPKCNECKARVKCPYHKANP